MTEPEEPNTLLHHGKQQEETEGREEADPHERTERLEPQEAARAALAGSQRRMPRPGPKRFERQPSDSPVHSVPIHAPRPVGLLQTVLRLLDQMDPRHFGAGSASPKPPLRAQPEAVGLKPRLLVAEGQVRPRRIDGTGFACVWEARPPIDQASRRGRWRRRRTPGRGRVRA